MKAFDNMLVTPNVVQGHKWSADKVKATVAICTFKHFVTSELTLLLH